MEMLMEGCWWKPTGQLPATDHDTSLQPTAGGDKATHTSSMFMSSNSLSESIVGIIFV
ncbi:hypothetical protein SRHO_G00181860 [Serrasalmus rhombeus]